MNKRIFLFLLAILLLSREHSLDAQGCCYTANRIVGGTKPTTCQKGPPVDVWIDTNTSPPTLNICGPANVWNAQVGPTGVTGATGPAGAAGAAGATGATGPICGSDTQVIYNSSAACAGSANLTFSGTVLTEGNPGIGAVSTDGYVLRNTTAAAAGAQQFSPRIRFIGQGWKTTATAASQQTEWKIENIPIQSTTSPNNGLYFNAQVNSGGFVSNPLFSMIVDGVNAPGSGDIIQAWYSSGGNRGLFLPAAMLVSVGGGSSFTGAPSPDGGSLISASSIKIRGDTGLFGFPSGTDPSANADTGISRNGAGVLEVNSGVKGTVTGTIKPGKYATGTVCASSGGTCGSAASGDVSIAAAATTVTVSTTAVNAASQIQISENSTKGTILSVTCNTTVVRTYAVTTVTPGTSFVITSSAAPAANPACISYTIFN